MRAGNGLCRDRGAGTNGRQDVHGVERRPIAGAPGACRSRRRTWRPDHRADRSVDRTRCGDRRGGRRDQLRQHDHAQAGEGSPRRALSRKARDRDREDHRAALDLQGQRARSSPRLSGKRQCCRGAIARRHRSRPHDDRNLGRSRAHPQRPPRRGGIGFRELRDVDSEYPERESEDGENHRVKRTRGAAQTARAAERRNLSYFLAVGCLPSTLSKAYWAHFSPSPLETPIEPMTWPSTMIGSAPFCGKSPMKAGARFSPLRTIWLVSDVARRQRSADFAFKSAVSIAFAAEPSMACDSMRLPPQSSTAIATVVLFMVAHSVQASTIARAPSLLMILMVRVACIAEASAANETASTV